MKDTDYVGTGMILKVTKDEETMSFIIVVQGDTSGDGIVTTADAAQVEFHILNKKTLEGATFRAADINRNKAVTGEDLATIIRKIQYLEPESINPNYVEELEDTEETNTEEPKDTEKTDAKIDNEKDNKENNTNSTINKNTTKENTTINNTTEEIKNSNTIKENTTKQNTSVNNTVEKDAIKENAKDKTEKEKLPENNTVQNKKQEE